MEEEILKKIEAQDKRLEEIYRSIEKMRKYFLWTLIITVAVIVLPLIGLLLVIPKFLSIYSNSYLGL
jgi:type II secretory pathway component PulF